eukprot:TRINITY_DN6629_c0_g1_i7.p1 TRINITY_DN6629_c0_g1~~TRINITY_DN6629_c0_g1_i7.p1  ORF type:complete len:832 (+),score=187.71 TRINITY_DN6629_c0_g1_i7:119-2497(+)
MLAAGAASVFPDPAELPAGLYTPDGTPPGGEREEQRRRRTESPAPQPGAGSLRWLLYDGHAAPHQDALGLLRGSLGVPPGRIAAVCFYLYCSIAAPGIAPHINETASALWADLLAPREPAGNVEAAAAAAWLTADGRRRAKRLLESGPGAAVVAGTDVAVCSFPGHNCMLLAGANVTLVVRFSHRFDHWTRPPHLERLQGEAAELFQVQWGWPQLKASAFISELRQLASSPRNVFAVTNAFDWAYLFHYTGIRALPWPATGALDAPDWEGHRPAPVVPIIPGHGPQCRAIAWFAAALKERGAQWQLRYLPRYRSEDMARWPCAVVLPYSLHAGMVIEAYAVGVPLLAPSLRLLSRLHAACGFVNHWTAQNLPRLGRDPLSEAANTSSMGPAAGWGPGAEKWLALADVYRLPHVTYFDSADELFRILDQLLPDAAQREELSAWQRQYMRRLRGHTAAAVADAVLRAVRSGAEPVELRGEAASCPSVDPWRGCAVPDDPLPGPDPRHCPAGCGLCRGMWGAELAPLRRGTTLATGGYAAGYGGYGGYAAGYAGGYSADTLSPTQPPTSGTADLGPEQLASLEVATIHSTPARQVTDAMFRAAFGPSAAVTGLSIPGFPDASFTVGNTPGTTPTRTSSWLAGVPGTLLATLAIVVSWSTVVADPARYKAAFAYTVARVLSINPAQLDQITFRLQSTGRLVGRRAEPLQDSVTATFLICPTSNCGPLSTLLASDDDGFPGWLIAMLVVLPLLFLGLLVFLVICVRRELCATAGGEEAAEDARPGNEPIPEHEPIPQ